VHFKIIGLNRIKKLEVNQCAKFGEAKTEGKLRKIENRLVPYKAPTLGHYPQLPESLSPPPPSLPPPPPPRSHCWIWVIFVSKSRARFTGQESSKPRLPVGLPVILGGIWRREPDKHFKHGPFAYIFT
jgi:hypothetical protein